MKLQYLIQQHQSELSELDRGILNYILSNGDTVLSMGIVELSEQVHVSKSSILRLTKNLVFLAIPSSNIFYGISKNKQQRFRSKKRFLKSNKRIFSPPSTI